MSNCREDNFPPSVKPLPAAPPRYHFSSAGAAAAAAHAAAAAASSASGDAARPPPGAGAGASKDAKGERRSSALDALLRPGTECADCGALMSPEVIEWSCVYYPKEIAVDEDNPEPKTRPSSTKT